MVGHNLSPDSPGNAAERSIGRIVNPTASTTCDNHATPPGPIERATPLTFPSRIFSQKPHLPSFGGESILTWGDTAEMHIELTLSEFATAVSNAMSRIVASRAQELNHASTYERGYLRRLIEEVAGVCGEMALAKHKGVWFSPMLNTFHRSPDCLGFEVRTTQVTDGRLIVRDNDADDRTYVLAITDGSSVRLVGWMLGGECKQARWADNPNGYRPCWMVPQKYLHPMATLGRS